VQDFWRQTQIEGYRSMDKFNFIDLFAGIGGFHAAVEPLGGTCVMASEIDAACQKTYKANFANMDSKMLGDIRGIDPGNVQNFDVVCAGFPCQSFSKAGKRKGFQDETRGDLFSYIVKMLETHKECKYLILENVRNLADNEDFWNVIQVQLTKLNFYVTKQPIVLSPDDFGIPQNRDRVFILGIKKEIANQKIASRGEIVYDDLNIDKEKNPIKFGDAFKILDKTPDKSLKISKEEEQVLKAWDEFKKTILIDSIDAPIWMQYFGETFSDDSKFYSFIKLSKMPDWKQRIVKRNRSFYNIHKDAIDTWSAKWSMAGKNKIYRKFEWNCKKDCTSLHDGIIQIRHSGVRVKRPTYFPALVAINNTPIVWDNSLRHYRRLSVTETAKLQSFPPDYKFLGKKTNQYKQLGNSVNVKLVSIVAHGLFLLGSK
jgi:DNA (cytosine-5)-methyltransferase 1